MRSPVESSMSSSRGFGVGETSLASEISESVVFPIAETVPTTFSPRRRASTKRRATWRTFSGSATDEPPNFITTVSKAGASTAVIVLRDETRPTIRAEAGRHGDAGRQRRIGHRVEGLHDERQMAGPDGELRVRRVTVVGAARPDLGGGLVERQAEHRRRLQLLARRCPRLLPASGEQLLGERLE